MDVKQIAKWLVTCQAKNSSLCWFLDKPVCKNLYPLPFPKSFQCLLNLVENGKSLLLHWQHRKPLLWKRISFSHFSDKADKLGQERNLDFDVMKLKRGSSLSYLYMKIETKDFWELPFLQYEQKNVRELNETTKGRRLRCGTKGRAPARSWEMLSSATGLAPFTTELSIFLLTSICFVVKFIWCRASCISNLPWACCVGGNDIELLILLLLPSKWCNYRHTSPPLAVPSFWKASLSLFSHNQGC